MIDFSVLREIVISEGKCAAIDINDVNVWRAVRRYGFRREKANSDPSARITYLYDAEGMTPMSVDLTTGIPSYGSWMPFINEVCRPVMLKYDGTVDYELDHSDQTKRLDGTESDVSNIDYAGNAMVEFRKYRWVHRSEDEQYEYIVFSNTQYDDTYTPYAFTNEAGIVCNAFYWGMYSGTDDGKKLRSIGSGSVSTNKRRWPEIVSAKANGSGWYTIYKSGWDYISDLLTLLGKSDNSQAVYGYGRISPDYSDFSEVGILKNTPAFCGYSDGISDMKALYIESPWGNAWESIAGLLSDGSKIKVKMTPPYDSRGVGYHNTGVACGNASGGCVNSHICTNEAGYVPLGSSNNENTYMCDGYYSKSGSLTYALIGGGCGYGQMSGSRFLTLYSDTTYYADNCGTRLSYLSPYAPGAYPKDIRDWDVSWEFDGALPPSSEWTYPVSNGTAVASANDGVYCYTHDANGSYSGNYYVAFRHKDTSNTGLSQCAVLEAEIKAEQLFTDGRGIRLTLGEGIGGSPTGRCLNVSLKQAYNESVNGQGVMMFHVYTGSTNLTSTTSQPKTYFAYANAWHKVRLELDTVNNINRVFIDDVMIATVDNSDLSTQSANYWQTEIHYGRGRIRAIRYKNLEG